MIRRLCATIRSFGSASTTAVAVLGFAAAFGASACTAYGYNCSGSEPAYYLCLSGDFCGNGTSCITANTNASGSGGVYPFCSMACSADSDCPPGPGGRGVVCVAASGATGICYARCDSADGSCLGGFTCTPEGAHHACVPSEVVDYYGVCGDSSGYYGP